MIDEKAIRITFVVFPGVHLLDLTGPAHIFYEAIDYGANYKLGYISPTTDEMTNSSAGMAIGQLKNFETVELSERDIIFIPGMIADYYLKSNLQETIGAFLDWLSQQSRRGVMICSVCTGAFVLAEAGLLNGITCTTHWKYFDRFEARFPRVKLLRNRLFVENDKILTSAGVASGIDLALHLVEKHHGSKFASDIAREVVVYLRRGEEEPQLSVFLRFRNHLVDPVHSVQDYLNNRFSNNPTLMELADIAHTSERNLTRMFKKATGITIGRYQDLLRLDLAQRLIKDGSKMEVVARQCGYGDVSQLYKLLKKN